MIKILLTVLFIITTIILSYFVYIYILRVKIHNEKYMFENKVISDMKNSMYNVNICIILSNNSSIVTRLMNNMYSEYSYKYKVISNLNENININNAHIIYTTNTIFLYLDINESIENKEIVISEFINHTLSYNLYHNTFSSILCIDDINQKQDNLINISKCISNIIDTLKLNIPIYYLNNSMSYISNIDDFTNNIHKSFYLNILGFAPKQYSTDTIKYDEFVINIDSITYKIKSLVYNIFNRSDSGVLNDKKYNLLNIYEDFKNNSIKAYNRFSYMYKNIICQYRPIVRGIFFTCESNINESFLYLFVYEIFTSYIPYERHVVNTNNKVLANKRNTTVEYFIYFISIILIIYTSYCSFEYISFENKNQSIVQDISRLKNSFKSSNNYIDISKITKITNLCHKLSIEHHSSLSCMSYISNLLHKTDKNINKIVNQSINYIYIVCRNKLIKGIKDNLYSINEDILHQKTDCMAEYIVKQNNYYSDMVDLHNSYHDHKDKYIYICKLISSLYKIDTRIMQEYSAVSKHINLYKFSDIEINKDQKIKCISNYAKFIMDNIDSQNIYAKLTEYKNNLDNLISSMRNVSIDTIKSINYIVENQINCTENADYFDYKEAKIFINTLYNENCINENLDEIYKLINIRSAKNIENISKIKNQYIGNIYNVKNEENSIQISMSDACKYLIDLCKSLYESSFYKKIILDNSYVNHIRLNTHNMHVLYGLKSMISFVQEYKKLKLSTLNDDFISIEFGNMLDNIIELRFINFINDNSILLDSKNINSKTIDKLSKVITQEIDNQENLILELMSTNIINIDKHLDIVYSSYIKYIYEYIIRLNNFYEDTILKIKSDINRPLIKNLYMSEDINDLQDKFKDRVENLTKIFDEISPIIYLVKQNGCVIASSEKPKYQYIENTLNIIKQYENNSGKLYLFNREIIDLFNADTYSKIITSKLMLTGNDYIKDVYKKYIESIRHYQDKKINNELLVIANILFQEKNKIVSTSPMCKTKGINAIDGNSIMNCINMLDNIKEIAAKVKRIDINSVKFNTIYEICSKVEEIKKQIINNYKLSIEINVDETVSKYFKNINIDCGSKSYNYTVNSGISYIEINLGDDINISSGPLSSSKYKIKSSNNNKFNSDINGFKIIYKDSGILSIQQESNNCGFKSNTHISDSITIPIQVTNIDYNTGKIEEFQKDCYMKIYIEKPTRFNDSISKLNDIINKLHSVLNSKK